MLNKGQFRELVIRPTLNLLDLWSPAAEELVLGTALVESKLTYLHQVGGGPALGLYQCEPATLHDILTNFLNYNVSLRDRVLSLKAHGLSSEDNLVGNAFFSTAICRVHYRRVRASLPEAGDFEAMGLYWKRYYNTSLGAGEVQDYVNAWKKL